MSQQSARLYGNIQPRTEQGCLNCMNACNNGRQILLQLYKQELTQEISHFMEETAHLLTKRDLDCVQIKLNLDRERQSLVHIHVQGKDQGLKPDWSGVFEMNEELCKITTINLRRARSECDKALNFLRNQHRARLQTISSHCLDDLNELQTKFDTLIDDRTRNSIAKNEPGWFSNPVLQKWAKLPWQPPAWAQYGAQQHYMPGTNTMDPAQRMMSTIVPNTEVSEPGVQPRTQARSGSVATAEVTAAGLKDVGSGKADDTKGRSVKWPKDVEPSSPAHAKPPLNTCDGSVGPCNLQPIEAPNGCQVVGQSSPTQQVAPDLSMISNSNKRPASDDNQNDAGSESKKVRRVEE
jgi:hypothetical protein